MRLQNLTTIENNLDRAQIHNKKAGYPFWDMSRNRFRTITLKVAANSAASIVFSLTAVTSVDTYIDPSIS